MDQELLVRRLSFGRWGLVVIGAAYLIGLIIVANVAFGTSTFFNRHATAPARTGGYDTQIPMVAAVNPDTIAKSITEATGGAPTIGLPLPAQALVVPNAASTQPTLTGITATTTPTYTATKRVGTFSWKDVLSIPTNLRYPPRAHPHRH